jgi:hypothetical protein
MLADHTALPSFNLTFLVHTIAPQLILLLGVYFSGKTYHPVMNFFEAQLRTTLWKACISEKRTENNQHQVVQTSNLVNTKTATKSQ